MTEQTNARYALLLLTALNFFNYVDRNVLFAVQPLIQSEFKIDDAKMGFLTTAFFICYMVAAPPIALLTENPRKLLLGVLRIRKLVPLPRSWVGAALMAARRVRPFPRKWIMAGGAVVWSLATLLSAV